MRELHSGLHFVRVLSPVASAANDTPLVGEIVDHRGYASAEYVISTGAIPDADATFVILLEESDAANMAGAVAVADGDLVGTEAAAAFVFDQDNEHRKLGYVGSKRYTRMTITPATNTGATLLSVLCVLGNGSQYPAPVLS